MRSFQINSKITIVCNSEGTRNGFRHIARLLLNGSEVDRTSVSYLNRTWESYEFQSVMQKLINKTTALSPEEKAYVKKWLEGDRTDWSGFQMTGMVAKMGDVLMQTPKEKNTWKMRMLKAGLGNKGLDVPEGWDKLPEATKTARLDKVLGVISGLGKKKKIKSSSGLDIAKETGVWN